MSDVQAFADTARGQLAQQEASPAGEAVTFYTSDGGSYSTADPVEITRLKASRSHYLSPAEAEDPVAADDTHYHPDAHTVSDVLAYLEENPVDAERVLAEERAGQARKGILGDKE